MIEGVIVQKLRQIIDDRGRVMHMIRADDPLFEKFGEIYFSEVLPGVVKAWKRHERMTQLFTVPIGVIKLVVYDGRDNSKSKENLNILEFGRDNYQLVKIPPKLWYGFKCVSEYPALLANFADLPHYPDESETIDSTDKSIPFEW